MENYEIIQKYCTNKSFVHFTFEWNVEGIKSEGLKPSFDGNIGKSLYCVDPLDDAAIERAIDNILEEDSINYRRLAEYLGYEDVLDIPDDVFVKDYIVPICFTYTGVYTEMQGENFGKNISGFVGIPIQNPIPIGDLTIGTLRG